MMSKSVHSRNSKTARLNFTKFLCMLPLAMTQSSFDGTVICYVLPVLWMTLCFHTMGPIGHNQARRYLWKTFTRWLYQLDIIQDNYSVWSSSSECSNGGKSTHTTVLQPPWILFRTTWVTRHQKGKTRKVKPIWIYWSKRE